MPKKCSICKNEHRQEIDSAILAGEPFRMLAKKFSVSESALWRHKQSHLLATLVKAQEIREVVMAGTLLEQLRSLQQKALELLAKAEAAGDYRGALAGVVAARGTLEVLVDIMSRLKDDTPVEQQFLSVDSSQVSGALEALLSARVIALSEGRPESDGEVLEVERQDSVTIEGGDMSREVGARCSEPPMQIG